MKYEIPDYCKHFYSNTGGRNGSIVIFTALPTGVPVDCAEMVNVSMDMSDAFFTAVGKAQFNHSPVYKAEVENLKKVFLQFFAAAGLPSEYAHEIPNEYWPETCVLKRLKSPWFRIHTTLGGFKVGWRKSVIELDWSDTCIRGKSREIFPDENVTRDDHYIHCDNWEFFGNYLKKLRGQRP